MQTAITALDLRYQCLRVADPDAEARLGASIEAFGQREPVLIVRGTPDDTAVLIDGFRRVRAVRRLGHELITVAVLPMDEVQALLFCHRIVAAHRRTAIEEAWLIAELCDGHHISHRAIAESFGRTPSWVSRRLALVRQLPATVQQHVRSGAISSHAAMRCLVPVARANAAHCEKLSEAAARDRMTSRQLERLYGAWRCGSAEGRQALVDDPALALRALDAIRTPDHPRSVPETRLADALLGVGRACSRARQILLEFVSRDLHRVSMDILDRGYSGAQISIRQLDTAVREVLDARS